MLHSRHPLVVVVNSVKAKTKSTAFLRRFLVRPKEEPSKNKEGAFMWRNEKVTDVEGFFMTFLNDEDKEDDGGDNESRWCLRRIRKNESVFMEN